MKQTIRTIFMLWLVAVSLHASVDIVVGASRQKSALQPELQKLRTLLAAEVPAGKIRIIPSSHPVWKWRLAVTGIATEGQARRLLAKLRSRYADAYLLRPDKKRLRDSVKEGEAAAKKDQTIEINFTNLKIVDFIKMVSKITGKNILISEPVEGNVEFVGTRPIPESKLVTLLNQVLASKKLTLLDSGDGYMRVVRSAEAVRSGPPLANRTDIEQIQTEIIPLGSLKVMDVIKQANALISKSGKVSVSNDTNTLIVTDYPANIRVIKEIVRTLSAQNSSDKTIRYVRFQHVDVDSVYSKVSQMVRAYFSNFAKSKQVRVIESPSANSIILVGSRKSIARVIASVKAFDRSSDQKRKDIEMVLIKNTDAAEVVKVLSDLISSEEFSKNIDEMADVETLPVLKKGEKGPKGDRDTEVAGESGRRGTADSRKQRHQDYLRQTAQRSHDIWHGAGAQGAQKDHPSARYGAQAGLCQGAHTGDQQPESVADRDAVRHRGRGDRQFGTLCAQYEDRALRPDGRCDARQYTGTQDPRCEQNHGAGSGDIDAEPERRGRYHLRAVDPLYQQ